MRARVSRNFMGHGNRILVTSSQSAGRRAELGNKYPSDPEKVISYQQPGKGNEQQQGDRGIIHPIAVPPCKHGIDRKCGCSDQP
jgi:hypothetical protein